MLRFVRTVRRLLPAAALIVAGALCAPAGAQESQALVSAGSVLRSGPSARHAAVQRLRGAHAAEVFGCTAQGGWCEVELLSDGMRGWVAESRLGALPEDLDHRTSTPLPMRGVARNATVTGVYVGPPWGYGWGGTVIEVPARGGRGEPAFPMRPGWARGEPMPR